VSATPTPQTARAAERQPTNFDGLVTEVVAVDSLAVTRSLACPCGSRTGRLLAGERFEDALWLDPLSFACDACGKTVNFFDSDRDGYDGRLGHGTTQYQATETAAIACPGCGASSLKVQCDLVHNIDASELDEMLGDKAHLLSDYFDWLRVDAECASCGHRFEVGDWELA
jgi:DNA-directed RNA polymerase subunit RPC12/RpoP